MKSDRYPNISDMDTGEVVINNLRSEKSYPLIVVKDFFVKDPKGYYDIPYIPVTIPALDLDLKLRPSQIFQIDVLGMRIYIDGGDKVMSDVLTYTEHDLTDYILDMFKEHADEYYLQELKRFHAAELIGCTFRVNHKQGTELSFDGTCLITEANNYMHYLDLKCAKLYVTAREATGEAVTLECEEAVFKHFSAFKTLVYDNTRYGSMKAYRKFKKSTTDSSVHIECKKLTLESGPRENIETFLRYMYISIFMGSLTYSLGSGNVTMDNSIRAQAMVRLAGPASEIEEFSVPFTGRQKKGLVHTVQYILKHRDIGADGICDIKVLGSDTPETQQLKKLFIRVVDAIADCKFILSMYKCSDEDAEFKGLLDQYKKFFKDTIEKLKELSRTDVNNIQLSWVYTRVSGILKEISI